MGVMTVAMVCALGLLGQDAAAIGVCGAEAAADAAPAVDGATDAALSAAAELTTTVDVGLDGTAEFNLDAGAGTDLVESIVPCAFVESGAFGAFCADVSVYVMTDNGLVLCQVPMLAFEGDSTGEHQFERRDASTSSVLQMGSHLMAMVDLGAQLPPPQTIVLDQVDGAYAPLLRAADRALGVPTSPA